MGSGDMGRFWDARAREDAFYFVDTTGTYGAPDAERFWEEGRRHLDGLLEVAGAEIRPDDVVVDIGCGVGRLTRVLARRAGHVHALDVSSEMLEQARAHNGQLTNVTWHHGDGTTLHPIGDASADAVISHVVFQHIPDPQVTLGYVREMGRVLKPGGWTAFQISNDPALHRVRVGVRGRVKAAIGHGPRGQDQPQWRGSAIDLGELRSTCAAAGLEIAALAGEGTQFCFVRAVRC